MSSDLARQPDGKGYLKPIEADISPKTLFALVLISDPKHKKVIKTLLDRKGIPSQFMLSATVDRAKITVYSNVLKQINAKVRQDLYRVLAPQSMQNCMVVGVDVCHAGRRSLVGLAATYTPYFTQHFSKVYPQQLHKELIGKMQDGRTITKDF